MFLLVYGIVYVTQFLSMLVHRLITVMHMLAAAKMDSETPDDGFVEAERPNVSILLCEHNVCCSNAVYPSPHRCAAAIICISTPITTHAVAYLSWS